MPNVLTINDLDGAREEQRENTITYAVTLSGAYVQHVRGQNVGEVLAVQTALNPFYLPKANWGSYGPRVMYILNAGSTGYAMSICPGADPYHWLLIIYSGITQELNAGAYPAGLTTDLDIKVEARGRTID